MRKKDAEEKRKAKNSYNVKYQQQAMKQIKFVLNKRTDAELIKQLEGVGNIAGYLKRLIRADIEEGTEKMNCTKELKEWLKTEILVAESEGNEEALKSLKRTLVTLKAIEQGKTI